MEKRGRKPLAESVRKISVSLSLNPDVLKIIDKLAEVSGFSRSYCAGALLNLGVEEQRRRNHQDPDRYLEKDYGDQLKGLDQI